MPIIQAYLPQDRLRSILERQPLAATSTGSVLFADISGFTPLADALARHYGSRRGADELTSRLNEVYTALINEVERFGGSVIGFAGDAITCWFGQEGSELRIANCDSDCLQSPVSKLQSPALGAVGAALAMQQAMQPISHVKIGDATYVQLAIKTAIASGKVRRFIVGDPAIQLIDVLAGTTLDRMATAEHLTKIGELLIDETTAKTLKDRLHIAEWRSDPQQVERFARVTKVYGDTPQQPITEYNLEAISNDIQSWVLPALRERMQTQSGRFLAELRPATALFLRFSGLDFDNDPEAGEKLDRFIRHVQRVIQRHEAALVQLTTGDKGSYLYVAFGAPIAHDDDTRRAVVAALDLRNSEGHFPFHASLQIGISQGSMRVGPYGSNTRQTYGVLGEEVNMAARLMTNAMPGQILVTKAVYEAIADDFLFEEPQQIRVKGRSAMQTVYAVAGRQARISSHLQRLYEEPLAARDGELAQMQQSLAQVMSGAGRILRIEGSAGVGKSHLVATFLKSVENLGISSVTAVCQSTERDTAYHAVRQITRTLFHLSEQMDAPAMLERIEETVRNTNPNLLLRLPLLGEIIGIEIPDNATTASLDPKLRQEALQSLAVELLQSGARRSPLVLVAEDVHWMDEASQSLLLALARMIEAAPILLLVVHRPRDGREGAGEQGSRGDFLTELAGLASQDFIRLEELPPSGTIQLVSQRLQGGVSPLAIALIQAQAQGNPFFTEELVDALRESGRLLQVEAVWTLSEETISRLQVADCLLRDGEEWQLRPDAPLSNVDLGVPTSIQGVILSRLDRLPESVKPTSKVASVIGRLFEFDLLVRAHPLQTPAAQVGDDMTTLVERDFARIERPEPSLAYIFKHNITQEVAYNTLLEQQRREIHQSVAIALEAAQPDAIDRLAFHFYNGDLAQPATKEKALHYLDRAAARAQRDYANETALSYLNRVLQLEQRRQWLKAKVEVLDILGRREQQEATLHQLTGLVGEDDFETLLLWGKYYESVSEYEKAKTIIRHAQTLAQSGDETKSTARCLNQLGMIAWRQGHFEEAGENYIFSLTNILLSQGEESDIEANARYGLGLVYRQQGKYEEAQSEFEQVLLISRKYSNRTMEARTLNILGGIALLKREETSFQQAMSYIQQSLDIHRTTGDRSGLARGLLHLAQTLRYYGDCVEAERISNEALTIFRALGDRWHAVTAMLELGIIYWTVGYYDQAMNWLLHAQNDCARYGHESLSIYVLLSLGITLRDQDQLTESESILRDGLNLAISLGETELEATYWGDLAFVYFGQKQTDRAIECAKLSLQKYRELDLQISATGALALLGVSHLSSNQFSTAVDYARQAIEILDSCNGEGTDFPQRDYLLCAQVFQACNEQAAGMEAITSAYNLLMGRAERISSRAMHQSFLENVQYHRLILEAYLQIQSNATRKI